MFYFEENNIELGQQFLNQPEGISKLTIQMKQLTVNAVKDEIPYSYLLQCDRVVKMIMMATRSSMLSTQHLYKQFFIGKLDGHVSHSSHEWIILLTKMS